MLYERAVGYYLEQQGYQILEYNYRCKIGEIDLIARDGEYLVFVEVKYRRDQGKGDPLEAVDRKKQRKICRCAGYYLLEHHLGKIPCRFDVAGIEAHRIVLLKDAFLCD